MQWLRFLVVLFFIIGIVFHIYALIIPDDFSVIRHILHIIAYTVCAMMLYSKTNYAFLLYLLAASFPFYTHVYGIMIHYPTLNSKFWICIVTCIFILMGGVASLQQKKILLS